MTILDEILAMHNLLWLRYMTLFANAEEERQ